MFLKLVFYSMYSLCRYLIRCINHLVLDSADSSEVPGTIQMHLLICNSSDYLITKEPDSETCIFFPSYFSTFSPTCFSNLVKPHIPLWNI